LYPVCNAFLIASIASSFESKGVVFTAFTVSPDPNASASAAALASLGSDTYGYVIFAEAEPAPNDFTAEFSIAGVTALILSCGFFINPATPSGV